MANKIIITNSTSDGTPSAGTTEIRVDSTTKVLSTVDDAGAEVVYGAGGGGGLDKWVSATAYSIDDVVWVSADSTVYTCTTGNSDVSFTAGNWQELSIQTGAQIKTKYEAESNAYTDTKNTKLAGIETAADVTDATNVNAAGAVMNSDSTTAGMSFVIDEDAMGSDSDTKVPTQQSVKAYVDTNLANHSYSETLTSGNWVLDSGTIYYQDVAHGLGTIDLVKSFRNTADDSDIIVESVVATDTNNIRVKIEGNSLNVRLTVTSGVAGSIAANTAVFTSLSSDTTLNTTTHKYIKVDTTSGDITLTLPLSANGLWSYDIWKISSDTNNVIIARAGSDTIVGETTVSWDGQYDHFEFVPDTATTWFIK